MNEGSYDLFGLQSRSCSKLWGTFPKAIHKSPISGQTLGLLTPTEAIWLDFFQYWKNLKFFNIKKTHFFTEWRPHLRLGLFKVFTWRFLKIPGDSRSNVKSS